MAAIFSTLGEYQKHQSRQDQITDRVCELKDQIVHDLIFNQDKEITDVCEFYGFFDADIAKKFMSLAARCYAKNDEDADDVLDPYLDSRVDKCKVDR